jgi:hypothetical protein
MAAAGKFKVYDFAKKYIGDGTFDLDDATNWKAALFQSTSNCDTLSVGTGVYGDLTNETANGNGYLTGGVAVTGVVWTRSSGTITFDMDNPAWTASGGDIVGRFLVLYKNATVNLIVKPLLCVCLLDTAPANVTIVNGTTTTITINASGVFTLSGADTN